MKRASDEGVLIGILDMHGNEIVNGDRIRVEHVNYKGHPEKERVDENFIARVFYHKFRAAFLYTKEGVSPKDIGSNTYHFNHRSSRFEILDGGEE